MEKGIVIHALQVVGSGETKVNPSQMINRQFKFAK